jgi:iron complex outermembrane receptor protein
VTATKTDTPLVETPQSISVVTKDQIAAQGATTVTQALNYAPGLSLNTYGANSLFDTITVRGFQAPLFLDGLRLPVDSATTFVTPRIVPYGLEASRCCAGRHPAFTGRRRLAVSST